MRKGCPSSVPGPRRAKMAAPRGAAGEFESWLGSRLDALEVDRDVYGVYILGVLQEEESEEEKMDALRGILSAFLEEDALENVCREIVKHWTESSALSAAENKSSDELQAIADMIEKQAQIVVKQREVSEEEKKRKQALLAQYSNITDDEDEAAEEEETGAASTFDSNKSLFKNTNLVDVMNAKKQEREKAREDSQKKREQDKVQREKDKLAKQERKEKEKKRTQKGERKR
ncbi:coiled-coil domain-containing protein 43 [Lepisosteus oculatus]|uniref:coiled-coil domain-containing protein 43 n=1 Tax=Lepisosteus oculatus TaxID=7918 RepID=UPI00073FD5AE|nr:PREDICTED: coiled-coil domain-containing protein 43 [Lepisosteus oculatus]